MKNLAILTIVVTLSMIVMGAIFLWISGDTSVFKTNKTKN